MFLESFEVSEFSIVWFFYVLSEFGKFGKSIVWFFLVTSEFGFSCLLASFVIFVPFSEFDFFYRSSEF